MADVVEGLLVPAVVGLMLLGVLSGALGYLMRTYYLYRYPRHRRRRRRVFPSVLPRRRSRMTFAAQLQYLGCGTTVFAGILLIILILAREMQLLP